MKVFLAVLFSFFAVAAHAQSISPINAEAGRGKVRGSFTVGNPEIVGMTTTVSVRSASFNADGSVAYRPLDSDVTVDIAETSAKIGPRQQHVFYFTAECRNPKSCVVIFLPSSTYGRAVNGMQIRIVLPFTTYICSDTAHDCRKRIRTESGIR